MLYFLAGRYKVGIKGRPAARETIDFTTFKETKTKNCLILAQPVPVAGYNLPVQIVVGANPAMPLHKYGFGNIEFGEDLPKCRNRVPMYYNNAGEFVDLRGFEGRYYCR